MDTLESSGLTTTDQQAPGFLQWLQSFFARFFGGSAAIASTSAPAINDLDDETSSEGYVIAPGGYRIRVPQPGDLTRNVGQMIDSVRAGLLVLPPLPHVVTELLREIQNDKSSSASIAEIASSDPALAASLLQTVNSAAMGLNRKITSANEAVSFLGLGVVKSMVIGLRLSEILKPKTPQAVQDAEDLWIHSLAVSYAAECLAQRVPGVDRGFVSTLGLLHDVGKMAIIAQFPDKADDVRAAVARGENQLAAEQRILGTNHATLGADLAAMWKLPADLVQAIRWHHDPAGAFHATDPLPIRKAVHVVQIANQLAKYCFAYADRVEIDSIAPEAFAMLGLEPSLPKLLTPPIRSAIGKAIFFAETSTRREITSGRRFLRPMVSEPAIEAIENAGDSSRAIIDDAQIAALFVTGNQPIDLEKQTPDASAITIELLHLIFRATPDGVKKCLATACPRVEAMELSAESRAAATTTLRSLIPNLLPLSTPEQSLELVLSRREKQLKLAVRAPGLATISRIPGITPANATSRLIEADLANVLNLGWFENVTTNTVGNTIVFATR